MKYRIGDKVIFLKKSNKEDAWPLKDYEEYEILNSAFDNMGIETYYGVKDKNGQESTWYIEMDFMTLREARKLKLNKLQNV